MNATLTDDKSISDNQCENSKPDEGVNYMAFTFVVNSESREDIEKPLTLCRNSQKISMTFIRRSMNCLRSALS